MLICTSARQIRARYRYFDFVARCAVYARDIKIGLAEGVKRTIGLYDGTVFEDLHLKLIEPVLCRSTIVDSNRIDTIGLIYATFHQLAAPLVCVTEPPPNRPSVFPSIAREATPPQPMLDWVAVPLIAIFSPGTPEWTLYTPLNETSPNLEYAARRLWPHRLALQRCVSHSPYARSSAQRSGSRHHRVGGVTALVYNREGLHSLSAGFRATAL